MFYLLDILLLDTYYSYYAAQETERKRALSALLSQTNQQEWKDTEVRN